jgi:ParB/RepB/Spo0J family partition protein
MTRPTYMELPHALIDPSLDNIRHQVAVDPELAASIAQHGVIEPLLVHPHPDWPGRYLLVAGHRRHAAAGTLTPPPAMPCMVHDVVATRAELVALMLTENLHRANLTAVEEAEGYEVMALDGLTDKDIAALAGFPAARVRGRRRLSRLESGMRDRLHAGQMTLEQAEALIKHARDKDAIRELTVALDSSDHGAWVWALKRAETRAQTKAERGRVTKDLQQQGMRVVDSADMPEGWRPYASPDPWAIGGGNPRPELRTLEAHAATSCDQLVVMLSRGLHPDHYCLTPASHPDDPDTKPEPAAQPAATNHPAADPDDTDAGPDPDAAALQRIREQEADDASTAAALRRDHLVNLITGTAPLTGEMRDAVAGVAAELLAVFSTTNDDWHELALWVPELLDDPDDDDQVRAALTRLTGPQALLAVLAADAEQNMDRPYSWTARPVLRHRAYWWRLLGGPLGYEWSAWELARFEAAGVDPAAVPTEPERPIETVTVAGGVL